MSEFYTYRATALIHAVYEYHIHLPEDIKMLQDQLQHIPKENPLYARAVARLEIMERIKIQTAFLCNHLPTIINLAVVYDDPNKGIEIFKKLPDESL